MLSYCKCYGGAAVASFGASLSHLHSVMTTALQSGLGVDSEMCLYELLVSRLSGG